MRHSPCEDPGASVARRVRNLPSELSYEEMRDAWIADQIAKAPPLTEWQKQVIRTAFSEARRNGAAA